MWQRIKLFGAWLFDWFILPVIESLRNNGNSQKDDGE